MSIPRDFESHMMALAQQKAEFEVRAAKAEAETKELVREMVIQSYRKEHGEEAMRAALGRVMDRSVTEIDRMLKLGGDR